uniref:Dolichyl-diphosphooligosaccharide--protein glycosyltransferase subunit 4 n=1 Tax=Panagrellus redivivus TaxID=6233 RepID=A0A7E4VKY2_PANRE
MDKKCIENWSLQSYTYTVWTRGSPDDSRCHDGSEQRWNSHSRRPHCTTLDRDRYRDNTAAGCVTSNTHFESSATTLGKTSLTWHCTLRPDSPHPTPHLLLHVTMITDVHLGVMANVLGIAIFILIIAYHYITANQKKQ